MSYRNVMRRFIVTPRILASQLTIVEFEGFKTVVDGQPAHSIISPFLHLRDAQDRVFTDKGRRFNIAAAIAQWSATMIDLPLKWTAQFMIDKEVDDTELFAPVRSISVFNEFSGRREDIEYAIDTLQKHRTTTVTIRGIQTYHSLVDLHFFIHNGNLNCNVGCGSMDIIREYPYVVFTTAAIAEFVAKHVGVNVGDIYYQLPMIYLLESDAHIIENFTKQRWPFKAEEMPKISFEHLERYRDLVTIYLKHPSFDKIVSSGEWEHNPSLTYLKHYALVLRAFVYRNDNSDIVETAHTMLKEQTLKHVLRQWLVEAGTTHIRRPSGFSSDNDFETFESIT